jgi:hypothetical protein
VVSTTRPFAFRTPRGVPISSNGSASVIRLGSEAGAAGLTAAGVLSAGGLATLDLFAEAGECLRTVRGAIRVPREPG